MTRLSVNVNKIALLRNSRGGQHPDVADFVRRAIDLGVRGITVHPRPDERHITRRDVFTIARLLEGHPGVEFNIEGYPSGSFLALIDEVRPAQCTLVPDAPDQLTSDHGWDMRGSADVLAGVLERLRSMAVRSSLFMDPDPEAAAPAAALGADRVELYTEEYARAWGTDREAAVLERYRQAAGAAAEAGLGINAGHDLNLGNLPRFMEIPGILEVSIGHALVVESLERGFAAVVSEYLTITGER
ncbi:MAG: pyridoxine 5'-phosphate synthase [Pseudohongiellaceae bacterium]